MGLRARVQQPLRLQGNVSLHEALPWSVPGHLRIMSCFRRVGVMTCVGGLSTPAAS